MGNDKAAIESVDIKNRWCRDIGDPNDCLCRLTNATILVLDESSTIVTEKVLGNTCGLLDVVANFGSAPEFYQTIVSTSRLIVASVYMIVVTEDILC